MIVIIDRFTVGTQAQMHVADLIPGIVHVVLVAQYLGELIQGFAVGVVQFTHGLGFLLRIGRAGHDPFQFVGLGHGLIAGGIGLGRRLFRLYLDRRGGNFVLRRISGAVAGDSADAAGTDRRLASGISLAAGLRAGRS